MRRGIPSCVLALVFVASSCGDGFAEGGSLDDSSEAARDALIDTLQAVLPWETFHVDTTVNSGLCLPASGVAANHWVRVAAPDEIEDLDALVEAVRDYWIDKWDLTEADLWFRLNTDVSAVEVRLDYFKLEFLVHHEAHSVHARAFTACYPPE